MSVGVPSSMRTWVLGSETLAPAGVGLLVAIAIGSLAASQGGYFPNAWGWAALAFSWTAALALVLRRRIEVGRLEIALVGLLTALLGWIALSLLWTPTTAGTIDEVERTLVYVTGAIALFTVATRTTVPYLVGGLLAAGSAVCAYALATRLFPERFAVPDLFADYRLYQPLGYWNALGLFAAIGLLLAVGVAVSARTTAASAAAGASLVIFAPTLYFTFSRGAWAALAVALVCWLSFTPHRLRLLATVLVAAAAPAAVLLVGAMSDALTHRDVALEDASRAGHRLAWLVLALLPVAALAMVAFRRAEARVRLPERAPLAFVATLAVAAVAGLALVFSLYGGPVTLVRNAYDSFRAPLAYDVDLNERLFRASNGGRIEHWKVAWNAYAGRPVLGTGAGSFEQYWYEQRPNTGNVRNAHNLYLETLAELGPLGLALLLAALALPVVAAFRVRGRRYVPVALAAYVAFLVHAAVDADWEMPALTLTGICCAGIILFEARDDRRLVHLPFRARLGVVAALVPMAGFALVAFVGNNAMNASDHATRHGDWARGADEARKAAAWAPWAAEPWRLLALADEARGNPAGAVVAYRRAIENDPRNWRLWYGLAQVAPGAERDEALLRVRELNPNLDVEER